MKIQPRDIFLIIISILVGIYNEEISFLLTGSVNNGMLIMVMTIVMTVVFLYMFVPFLELAIYFSIVIAELEDYAVNVDGKTKEDDDEINNIITNGFMQRDSHEETSSKVAEFVRSRYGK